MTGELTLANHALEPHILLQGEAHVRVALLDALDARIPQHLRMLSAPDALALWFLISTRNYADLLAIILLILIGIGIHVLTAQAGYI
jgi:hypothetical protein